MWEWGPLECLWKWFACFADVPVCSCHTEQHLFFCSACHWWLLDKYSCSSGLLFAAKWHLTTNARRCFGARAADWKLKVDKKKKKSRNQGVGVGVSEIWCRYCLMVAEIMMPQLAAMTTALTPRWAWWALDCVSAQSLYVSPCGGRWGWPGACRVMDGKSSDPLFPIPWPPSSHCLPRAQLCW